MSESRAEDMETFESRRKLYKYLRRRIFLNPQNSYRKDERLAKVPHQAWQRVRGSVRVHPGSAHSTRPTTPTRTRAARDRHTPQDSRLHQIRGHHGMAGIPLHMYHNMEDARSGPVKRDGSIYLKRFIPWHRRRHGGCTAPYALSVPKRVRCAAESWRSPELSGHTLLSYPSNCVLNGPSLL